MQTAQQALWQKYAQIQHESFHEHFHAMASKEPNKQIYTFLDENGMETHKITASQLDDHAKHISRILQSQYKMKKNDRIILLCNPGYEFVQAFFGCMYAGLISVPSFPPLAEVHFRKLFDVATNCEAKYVLLSTQFFNIIKDTIPELEKEMNLPYKMEWISFDTILQAPSVDEHIVDAIVPCASNDVMFLQYTSGSTGNT